jgi:Domain of unknown function (DUF4384)
VQDLKSVRRWIAGMPRIDVTRCRGGLPDPSTTSAAVTARVLADLREQLPLRRPKLRYLSLATVQARCAPAFTQAEAAIRAVSAWLAPSALDLEPVRLDAGGALWRVDLDEMAMTPEQWRQVAERAAAYLPRSEDARAIQELSGGEPVIVRTDALVEELSQRADQKGETFSAPLAALHALFHEPLDGEAAAAELGVSAGKLREALWRVPAAPHARLLTAIVSREQFSAWHDALTRQLDGVPSQPSPPTDRDHLNGKPLPPPAVLTLVTPRTQMTQGDLLTVAVTSTVDCALEVIDIDPTGRATQLLPNDFQRDNQIKAGQTLLLPGPAAPYQMRLDRSGTELIVAQCSAPGAKRARSDTEFIRQQFLDLGNWERYLDNPGSAGGRKPTATAETPPLLSRAGVRLTISDAPRSAWR